MEPLAALEQRYDIGRGLIFYRDAWNGEGSVWTGMEHLGDTVGGIKIEPNPEYSNLTVNELFGPAILKRYFKGMAPTIPLTVFPTPDKIGVISPTGFGSAGAERQRLTKEYTLWIVPEALFMKADANGFQQRVDVTWAGGVFLKDGDPLTDAEQELADLSYLIWRGDFEPLTPAMMDENGGYAGTEVNLSVQQQFIMQDGCQLYLLLGELALFTELDLDGFIS
jgi:hypothetical protein